MTLLSLLSADETELNENPPDDCPPLGRAVAAGRSRAAPPAGDAVDAGRELDAPALLEVGRDTLLDVGRDALLDAGRDALLDVGRGDDPTASKKSPSKDEFM